MNKKIMLYIATMAILLAVIPSTISLYANQHTFYGKYSVSCMKCHFDIQQELNDSQNTIYNAHRDAAHNTNYTTYLAIGGIEYNASNSTIITISGEKWVWKNNEWERTSDNERRLLSLDHNDNGIIDGQEICFLCHGAALFGLKGHANVTVRTCDDDRCHGNKNNFYNDPDLFENSSFSKTAAGNLISKNNVHKYYYNSSSNESSNYNAGKPFNHTPGNTDPSGSKLSKGYWTCLGCHSQVTVNVSIKPAEPYNHSDPYAPKHRYVPSEYN